MSTADLLAQILRQLGEARVRCPEFRFGQMIAAIGTLAADDTGFSLWDIEDADFLAALDRFSADMAVRSALIAEPVAATGSGGVPSSPGFPPTQPPRQEAGITIHK